MPTWTISCCFFPPIILVPPASPESGLSEIKAMYWSNEGYGFASGGCGVLLVADGLHNTKLECSF